MINPIDYLSPEFLILVAVVYSLGMFLKGFKGFPDWMIPLALLGFSIIFAVLYNIFNLGGGFCPAVVIEGIIQGIFAAAAAVFTNQIFVQATRRESSSGGQ